MQAGQLRHPIQIMRRSSRKDDYGGSVSVWTLLASVRANVRVASGNERVAAGSQGQTLTHTVIVRYREDLLPAIEAGALRIVYPKPGGDSILNITSMRDLDERRKWLIFSCVEGRTDGG